VLARSTTDARRVRPFGRRLAAGIVATGLLIPLAAAVGSTSAAAGEKADGFVSRINHARVNHGQRAYTVRADLVAVAQAQADRMAGQSRLFHNPDLTSDVAHWLAVGENVGVGPSVDAIADAFMHSPEHRANILDGDYTEVGVGTKMVGNTLWVAEVFRKPSTTTSTAVQFTHPLRLGSHGRDVAWVQHRLNIRSDGLYGLHTRHRVHRFKVNHGLPHDGIVGHRTWRKLHRTR
jgi:peptidoglycan hydrolase-like protein with peptidoglycan-binding domain